MVVTEHDKKLARTFYTFLFQPQSGNIYAEKDKRIWLGNHGFDNAEEDMRSIFVAKGPGEMAFLFYLFIYF